MEGIAGFDSLRAFGLLSHTCRPDLLLQEAGPGRANGLHVPQPD